MNAIYSLADEVQEYYGLSADYIDKMMHRIPDAEVINREKFILERAKDKVVLDIGCTGPMAEAISNVASEYHGMDKLDNVNINNYIKYDLDRDNWDPHIIGLELIIAGEVIEHLSNAGHFLDFLGGLFVPVILTTPNARHQAGYKYIKQGIECVNKEHVAFYSYHTLKVLVERHGFDITEWYWYNGKPGTAEGLIFCLE